MKGVTSLSFDPQPEAQVFLEFEAIRRLRLRVKRTTSPHLSSSLHLSSC